MLVARAAGSKGIPIARLLADRPEEAAGFDSLADAVAVIGAVQDYTPRHGCGSDDDVLGDSEWQPE